MGPPSHYNLYAVTRSHPRREQSLALADAEIDTASFSTSELAKHYLKLFAAAATPDEFNSRANAAFSRNVNITVNGIHLSRELYAQQWGASFHAAGAITFNGSMVTPDVRIPMLQNAALVGIMYDARFASSVEGRASAVSMSESMQQLSVSVSSTINLIIAEDKTLPLSTADRRRIVSVNQVIVDQDGLLTFPLRNL